MQVMLPSSLFFCFAFHVQSLAIPAFLAEDRGREPNLCDAVEVKKEKKR